MPNPTWSKRAQEIERCENKIAHAIGIIRQVEVLAELATTDDERAALLDVLRLANDIKQQALKERRDAAAHTT